MNDGLYGSTSFSAQPIKPFVIPSENSTTSCKILNPLKFINITAYFETKAEQLLQKLYTYTYLSNKKPYIQYGFIETFNYLTLSQKNTSNLNSSLIKKAQATRQIPTKNKIASRFSPLTIIKITENKFNK